MDVGEREEVLFIWEYCYILPILQMRGVRHREVKETAQGHTSHVKYNEPIEVPFLKLCFLLVEKSEIKLLEPSKHTNILCPLLLQPTKS